MDSFVIEEESPIQEIWMDGQGDSFIPQQHFICKGYKNIHPYIILVQNETQLALCPLYNEFISMHVTDLSIYM